MNFAREVRDTLATQGVETRIGADAGPVLIFELGNGARDIAGSPVNETEAGIEAAGVIAHIGAVAR